MLWRFGYPFAKGRCLEAFDRLQVIGDPSILIRFGLLVMEDDPAAARVYFDRAEALGAVLPKQALAGRLQPAPEAAPSPYRRTIAHAAQRNFPDPRGDGWHPAFDLAATSTPPLEFWNIPNGVLSVDMTEPHPRFYVFDAEGVFIPELSSSGEPFIERIDHYPEAIALVDDWFSAFNVCHFLFDKWPRLELFGSEVAGEAIRPLLFSSVDYYRDALAHSGYPQMAAPSSKRWSVSGTRLLLLSNHRRGEIIHPAFSTAPWARRFLRRHAQAERPGVRRIYVSRDDAGSRLTVNEAEVQALMRARGFEVVRLAGMSFLEQKRLFSEAGWIAGVHGAGLANLAFAGPGARVLEIMPPLAGTFAYWLMAGALGQDYWMFRADDAHLRRWPGASYDPSLGGRLIRVDVERLAAMLDEFLA